MIIKCRYCKREFDKPSYRNQHERDAHKKMTTRIGKKSSRKLTEFVRRMHNG